MKQLYRLYYLPVAIAALFFTSQLRADEVLEVHCNKPFPEAMMELQEAILHSGYKIVRIQKVDKGLQGSGYKSEKYRIIFFGRPNEIITLKEKHPNIIPLLPLKIALYADKEESVAIVANPRMYSKLYDNKELNIIFIQWQHDIDSIIKNFKSSCQAT